MKSRILLIIGIFFCSGIASGQIKTHQIGRIWQTMWPVGSLPSYVPLYNGMCYPGSDYVYGRPKNMDRQAVWIGVKDWTNKFGQFKSTFVSEGGYKNNEAPDILEPVSNQKYVRQRLPRVEVNEELEQRILDNRSSSVSSATLESDEKIVTVWRTDVGVEVTRNSYTFANTRHDSYIIQEYIFKNTGNVDRSTAIELPDQNLVGVYFGFWRTFIPSQDVGHEEMGGEIDDWCSYYGNQPGDTLRGFWYVYDGDNQRKSFDDMGDPSENTGEFLSPQHVAFGAIHADTDYQDGTDMRSQPSTVDFWPASRVHSHIDGDPEQTLYGDLSSGAQSRGSDTGEYDSPWDPLIQFPQLLMSFGPYDIPFGEDVRIVIFEAVGSIDRRTAIEAGRKWREGTLEHDGLTGDTAKNAIVASGKDTLFQIVNRAEWAWKHGLGSVPDGPESPNLILRAGPGKVELEWYYGTYGVHDITPPEPDVDTGVQDFSGYRIYRAEEIYTNLYTLIWECGGESGIPVANTYMDRDVKRGKSYYYFVTAFDDGSQNTGLYPGEPAESSHFSNRNYQFAAVPYEGAHTDMDSIYVVPNPFHFQGLEYGGSFADDYVFDTVTGARLEDRITFVGLPAKAVIRIFSLSGNLVKTLEHPNPDNRQSIPESADEMWFQVTDSWQTIKSGVYFYHVQGWDLEGKTLGDATGKFVVIR